MGRSHAWLPRGAVLVEPRPINWGDNMTFVGAIRMDRWLTLATAWGAMTRVRFVAWVRRHLVRHLRRGDIVVLDNLSAHKAPTVRALIEQAGPVRGATVRMRFLISAHAASMGIEVVRVRRQKPQRRPAFRCTAQRARYVHPRHCRNWFAHAGYQLK